MGATWEVYMEMKKFLNILLLWNPWSDFEIISQKCSLSDPFQKVFAKFWSVEETWLWWMGGALVTSSPSEQFFKISSSWNHLADFDQNLASQNVPWVKSSSKIVQRILIPTKTLVAMATCTIQNLWSNSLKITSSLKRLVRFWNNFTEMFLRVTLFSKTVHKILIRWRNMALMGKGRLLAI